MMPITRRWLIKVTALASAAVAGLARVNLSARAQESWMTPGGGRPPLAPQGPPLLPPEPPWESRRGLRNIDSNNDLVFIRAPMDDVAHALADRTERWERDVLGREVVLNPQCAFVFRLRGHSWTIIAPLFVPVPFGWALVGELRQHAPALSAMLKTRIIDFWVSDTTISIGYSLYENGELLEQLRATEDSGRPGTFTSRLRALQPQNIGNIWEFTHQFLVAQDVLEPGINFGYFLSPFLHHPQGGEIVRVVNSGFRMIMPDGSRSPADVPPIERVDYWVPLLSRR
jgi:hypothetical protein